MADCHCELFGGGRLNVGAEGSLGGGARGA